MDWEELWSSAAALEQHMTEAHYPLREEATYPADDVEMRKNNPLLKGITLAKPKKADPSGHTCVCCGKTGHFKHACPYKDYRCNQCQRIGHIRAACRNLVITDPKGRVDARVEPKQSGTVISQRKDKSRTEQMISMETVLAAIRGIAEKRAMKSTESRKKRKVASGWKPKRRAIDHPVGAAMESLDEEPSEEDSVTESDSATTDALEELTQALEQLNAQDEDPLEQRTTVTLPARINDYPVEVVIDSGASRSLCSTKLAMELGIQVKGPTRSFKGVGRSTGQQSEEVHLQLGELEHRMHFWVIQQDDLPTLIGAKELREMRVLIDPVEDRLLDPKSGRVLASRVRCKSGHQVQVGDPMLVHAAQVQQLLDDKDRVLNDKLEHLKGTEQEIDAYDLLIRFKDVWASPIPGKATAMHASFKVEGRPVSSKLRHLTPELRNELDRQVDAMLSSEVIRPSKSAWTSAPVFVRKKGGEWRLCLDFRRVNAQMVPDRYPLPLLWEQVQRAAHHRYYTCLDLSSGFWNLPLDEDSKQYTAFVTHRGTFEFNVLPFGIRNSPSEFQRLMDLALADLYPSGVFCYVDDIVVYANTPEENLKKVEAVLQRLQEHGLYVQLSKCEILKRKVKILGHIVSKDGILPDKDKVKAVWEARPPKDKKELRSFLGLTSYLRRFVPSFSQNVAPLNALLKKNAKYAWTDECQESYEWLRVAITDQVMLCAPQGDGVFVIACDASDYGVGAALMQVQDDGLAVIEFASRSLTDVQKRWPTYEKEAYAIRWSVGKFEDYVRTGTAYVLTDHQSLTWMTQASSGKVQRWSLYLQQFDLQIRHIAGEANCLADWLSRSVPDTDEFQDVDAIEVPSFPAEDEEKKAPQPGQRSQALIPYVPNVEDLQGGYKEMTEEDKKATYVAPDELRYSLRTNRLYIPPNCREVFLYWFHCSRYGGHCGVNRTIRRMSRWVWWPKMNESVRDFIKQCLICIRHGRPPKQSSVSGVLTRPLPFQLVSLDLVGPLNWGSQGWTYLCIVDHYSRYMVTRATDKPVTADWICRTFEEAWLGVFQAPATILSDRGPQFRSAIYREFVTQVLMALLVYTSPYYPQGNAVNEASHKAIGASLVALSEAPEATSFPAAVRDATMVYNSVPHVHTGQTPNFMLFGMELALPGWQKYQRNHPDKKLRELTFRTERLHQCARIQLTEERVAEAKQGVPIVPGDWIVFYLSAYEKGSQGVESLKDTVKAGWSLPAKVLEVHDKACTVLPWGVGATGRQVPLALVKKLEGCLPAVLAAANVQLMEKLHPRTIRHWALSKSAPTTPSTWEEAISKAAPGGTGEAAEISSKKRRRQAT